MVCQVYVDIGQFQSSNELQKAIADDWSNIAS